MAELFTEEDVQRLADIQTAPCSDTSCEFYDPADPACPECGTRAVLSALAEDGRLLAAGSERVWWNWCAEHEQWLPMCPQLGPHRVVERAVWIEPGGALPSDTPALAEESP